MNSNQADMPMMDEAQSPDIELANKNLAETLSDDKLAEISNDCKTGFELDLLSCSEWHEDMEEWIRVDFNSRCTL